MTKRALLAAITESYIRVRLMEVMVPSWEASC